jgi:ferric-dicitrate binding protein FerR (iron transport regulator)
VAGLDGLRKPPMHRANQKARPSRDEIQRISALWLARRDRGLTRGEEIKFREWRDSSRNNERAVSRLQAVWRALRRVPNRVWS